MSRLRPRPVRFSAADSPNASLSGSTSMQISLTGPEASNSGSMEPGSGAEFDSNGDPIDIYHHLNPNIEKLEKEIIEKHGAAAVAAAALQFGNNIINPSSPNASLTSSALAAKQKQQRPPDPVLVQSSAISYEGGVDSATGLYDGKGKLTTIFGYEYQGEFQQGLMHGTGTIRWLKTDITYSGAFDRNSITGRGRYEWPTGDSYTGDVLNGLRHGEGSMFVKTKAGGKSSYVGCWEHGRRHGKGMQIYPDGSKYSGDWVNDRRTGNGSMSYAGDSPGFYDGDWVADVRHGQGKMKWEHSGGSFELYEGSWVRGYPHGKGVATFVRVDPASSRTVVQLPQHSMKKQQSTMNRMETFSQQQQHHGNTPPQNNSNNQLPDPAFGASEHTMVFERTSTFGGALGTVIAVSSPESTKAVNRYEGEFCAGKRHGFGTFVFDDGSQYEGFWRDNVKHGEGKFTTANGVVFVATFDNGVPTRPLDEKSLRPETLYVPTLLPLYIVDVLGPAEIASADTMSSIQALISLHYGMLRKVFLHYCNATQDTSVPFIGVDLAAPRAHGSMLLVQFLKFCSDCRLLSRHVNVAAIGRMFLAFKDRDATTQPSAFFAESTLLAASTAAAGIAEVKSESKPNRRRPQRAAAAAIAERGHGSTTASSTTPAAANAHATATTANHTSNGDAEHPAGGDHHDNNASPSQSAGAATTTTAAQQARANTTNSGSQPPPASRRRAAPPGVNNSTSNTAAAGGTSSTTTAAITAGATTASATSVGGHQAHLSASVKARLTQPWQHYRTEQLHDWENPSPTLAFRDFVEAVIRVACMLYSEPFYGPTAQKLQIVIEEHIFRFAPTGVLSDKSQAAPTSLAALYAAQNPPSPNSAPPTAFFPLSRSVSSVLTSFKGPLRKVFDRFCEIDSLHHAVPRVAGQRPKEAVITMRQFAWILRLMGLLKEDKSSARLERQRRERGGGGGGDADDQQQLLLQQFGSPGLNNKQRSTTPQYNHHYGSTAHGGHGGGGSMYHGNRRSSEARSDFSATPPTSAAGGHDRFLSTAIINVPELIERVRTDHTETLAQGGVSLAVVRALWPYDPQHKFTRAMLRKYFVHSLKPRSKKQAVQQQQQMMGGAGNNAGSGSGGAGSGSNLAQTMGSPAASLDSPSWQFNDGATSRSVSVAGGAASGGGGPDDTMLQQTVSQRALARTGTVNASTYNAFNRSTSAIGGGAAIGATTSGSGGDPDSRTGSPTTAGGIDNETYESLLQSKLRVLDAAAGRDGHFNLDSTVAMDAEIVFIEFVELLCRVSDVVFPGSDLDDKVLKLMFEHVGPLADIAHTVQI